ncbi:MAG: BACON domain-containing protein [Alistipes sp.]|nr:BACON domain-containing protein [Alistipes sp.]
MKKLFTLFTLCTLSFVACEMAPSPVTKAIFTLRSATEMSFEAEGGDGTICYSIEWREESRSSAAQPPQVECSAEWVTIGATNYEECKFTVAQNEGEARDTKIVLTYSGESIEVVVRQAAKQSEEPDPDPDPDPDPVPEMATITLKVENIEWNNADIVVKPSADVEYVLGIMTKAKFDERYRDGTDTFVDDMVKGWQETAEMYQDMGCEEPWQYYMQNEQRSGEASYNLKSDEIYDATWDSEYVAYCFGMNDEGEQTATVATAEFRTVAPEASANTFTITLGATTKRSIEFTVEPTNDDPYYVTVEAADVLDAYNDDTELIRAILSECDVQIDNRTFVGTQTLTNADLGIDLNSTMSYKVVVWGFDEGPTTTVYMSEAFKPGSTSTTTTPDLTGPSYDESDVEW